MNPSNRVAIASEMRRVIEIIGTITGTVRRCENTAYFLSLIREDRYETMKLLDNYVRVLPCYKAWVLIKNLISYKKYITNVLMFIEIIARILFLNSLTAVTCLGVKLFHALNKLAWHGINGHDASWAFGVNTTINIKDIFWILYGNNQIWRIYTSVVVKGLKQLHLLTVHGCLLLSI
jgi:hypothetical protein